MKSEGGGYFFALTRLLTRDARKGECARWEIHSAGGFVFLFACVAAGRVLWLFVRPMPWRILGFAVLPIAVWIALLLFYFVNWTLAWALRRLGLYRAKTNNPLQHVVITATLSFFALLLLRDHSVALNSLGIFWLTLVGLNLGARLLLEFIDEK